MPNKFLGDSYFSRLDHGEYLLECDFLGSNINQGQKGVEEHPDIRRLPEGCLDVVIAER